jgi:hypothetical protein
MSGYTRLTAGLLTYFAVGDEKFKLYGDNFQLSPNSLTIFTAHHVKRADTKMCSNGANIEISCLSYESFHFRHEIEFRALFHIINCSLTSFVVE